MLRRGLFASMVAALGTVVAAISGASCGSGTPSTPVPDVGAPVRFGASLALTNDLAGRGKILQNAIRVAEQQLNANGGVLGRRLIVTISDDASDKGNVLDGNVRKLLDEGASVLLGPIGSSQVKVAAPIAAERKIFEFTATATSPELSTLQPNRNRFLFRTVPPDTLQAKALAVFAARGPGGKSDAGGSAPVDAGDAGTVVSPGAGCKQMSIIHNDDAYGNPFAAALTDAFKASGGNVGTPRKIPSEVAASYSADVAAVMAEKPECLALIVFSPAAVIIVRELKEAQKANPTALPAKFFIIGTDGSYRADLISEGRTNKADPSSDTSQYNEFKNLYLSQFGLEPGQSDLGFGVAGMYDATILAALAIEEAGGTDDPVLVRDALYSVSKGGRTYGPLQIGDALEAIRSGGDVDYRGASGDLNFNDQGDVVANYIIWKVDGAQFKTVEKIQASELGSP